MNIPRLIVVLLLSLASAKAGTDCDVFRVGLDDLIDRSAMVVKARIDHLIEYKPVWPRTAVTVTDVLRGSRRGLPKEVIVSGLNSAALCTQGAERGEEYYMFLSKCDEVDCAVTFQGLEGLYAEPSILEKLRERKKTEKDPTDSPSTVSVVAKDGLNRLCFGYVVDPKWVLVASSCASERSFDGLAVKTASGIVDVTRVRVFSNHRLRTTAKVALLRLNARLHDESVVSLADAGVTEQNVATWIKRLLGKAGQQY